MRCCEKPSSILTFNRSNMMSKWYCLCIFVLSFSLLFAVTLMGARILTKMVQIALLSKSTQWMNRSLGFVFGSIKGFFIMMVFIWIMAILPLQKWSNIIEDNSILAQKSNLIRINMVEFFNWEDPVALSESYLKQLSQP